MMMICFSVTISLLIFSLLVANTASYPDGAGACPGGSEAVGGPHTSLGFEKLTLADAGVKVRIGGNLISEASTVQLPADTSQEISVTAAEFVGVLIRVEAPKGANMVGVLEPGTDVANAFACSLPAVGITHNSRSVKSFVNGTLIFADNWKGVQLDITVVFSLRPSRFAYGMFKLDYFGSPTSAPIVTRPPTLKPTRAPQLPSPVSAPQSPVPAPAPRRRRMRPRTGKPTQRPTMRMRPRTVAPTKKPTRRPRL